MNNIQNLVYLKIHLESEIKLLKNQSIKQIYEDEKKNNFLLSILKLVEMSLLYVKKRNNY